MRRLFYPDHYRDGLHMAIGGAAFGVACVGVAGICAARGDAWMSLVGGISGGALLAGALLTYAKVRLWERIGAERQEDQKAPSDTIADTLRYPWPSPTAEKGSK